MKKLVFAAFAAVALTASVSFVSCNNTPAAAEADTLTADVEAVVDDVCDSVAACCDSLAEVVDSLAE